MKKEVMICFALVFVLSMSFFVSATFSGGGLGTSADPFQITNCNHLQQMNDNLTAFYKLIEDIDCSDTKNWNSNKGFISIGNFTKPFKGTFIGNDKGIFNLSINRSAEDYVGLFGVLGDGVNISDTGLGNAKIIGRNYVGFVGFVNTSAVINYVVVFGSSFIGNSTLGGFAGKNLGNISSSFSTLSNVTGTNDYVGGFVGENNGNIKDYPSMSANKVIGKNIVGGFAGLNNGEIKESYSFANLVNNKGNFVGGFAGKNYGTIRTSYSTGNVNGSSYVGGFAGSNQNVITDSYSTGNVNGSSYVGGFAGHNNKIIRRAYSIEKIKAVSTKGGFVGSSVGGIVNYIGNFWDINVTGYSYQDSGAGELNGVIAKDTIIMKKNLTFKNEGWDFTNVWAINEGISYPCLYWQRNDSSCPIPYVPPTPTCVWTLQNSTCANETYTTFHKTNMTSCTGTAPANETYYCDSNKNGLIGEICMLDVDDVFLDGEGINSSQNYTGTTYEIDLSKGNSSVYFSWDFANVLNICPIEIETSSSNASTGYIIVKNSASSGKTILFEKKSSNSSKVCIKDEEDIDSIGEISRFCNSTNEFLVSCPGTYSGYNCNISGDKFKVWPLNHSAVKEFLGLSNANVTNNTIINTTCIANWSCSGWSNCINDVQTQVCTDLKFCNTTLGKPSETQSCNDMVCIPDWTCTEWGDCIDDSKTRICSDGNSCGDDTDKPSETDVCAEIPWLLIGIIVGGIIVLVVAVILIIKMNSRKEDYSQEEVQTPPSASPSAPPKSRQDNLYYPR